MCLCVCVSLHLYLHLYLYNADRRTDRPTDLHTYVHAHIRLARPQPFAIHAFRCPRSSPSNPEPYQIIAQRVRECFARMVSLVSDGFNRSAASFPPGDRSKDLHHSHATTPQIWPNAWATCMFTCSNRLWRKCAKPFGGMPHVIQRRNVGFRLLSRKSKRKPSLAATSIRKPHEIL